MKVINWNELLQPYEQAVKELMIKFSGIKNEYALIGKHSPIEMVEGRVKRVGSILEKANRKNIPYGKIEQMVEDIAGIRIICKFVEDIEQVTQLIRKRDGIDLNMIEERDYVTNAKPSGYRSYHVIIKYPLITLKGRQEVNVEIQIRTLAMNFWATIEHSLKYKYNGNMPDDLQQRLIKSAEASYKLDHEMSTISEEILQVSKIIQMKNDLVDSIVKKIQRLHFVAHMQKMDEINRQFLELYQESDYSKLVAFNEKLEIMAELYNVKNE